jgi:anti-sigma B factor antagonist
MRPQLTILHLAGKPIAVLVSGEVDIYTAPDLHRSLCRAADGGAGESGAVVTVDLSAVSFIDARGLSTLVTGEAYAWVRGVRMLFTGLSPGITRLLRITGLSLRGGEDLTQHRFRS